MNKAQNRRHTAVWRRFLTQFRRKYTVLNHIGFNSPHLSGQIKRFAAGYFPAAVTILHID
ncbi:MAG: hypothetical protein ACI4SX_06890 [Candidatus Fimenecus sp.]